MKVAYLIIGHNNPTHLKRLISSLSNNNTTFFVHIDKKINTNFKIFNMKNVIFLKNRINVYWGGYSQIQSTLNLLDYASKHNIYDYFILLSGSHYPIKSNRYIFNYIVKNSGKEFIDLWEMPLHGKSFDRVNYYHIEGHPNLYINILYKAINIIIRRTYFKRKYPEKYRSFNLYAGSQWWGFSNRFVKYLFNFLDENKQFSTFYKNTYCPDEMFFHTIIGNSFFKSKIMNSFTYADWSSKPKPAIINDDHFPILSQNYIKTDTGNFRKELLFARKFTDNSTQIIKRIEKELRNNKFT